MRLFLLPVSTKRTLLYCQQLHAQTRAQKGLLEKLTSKASQTWLKWESTKARKWQKWVTRQGNAAFARIDYEEWALKGIPPLSTRRKEEELLGKEKVEVLFPEQIIKPDSVQDAMCKIATERQVLHRKGIWGNLLATPLTIPFVLIPIIPNLPFFYLMFRAWSHWRALQGSKHVEYLLDKKLVTLAPSKLLKDVYNFIEMERVQMSLQDLQEDKGIQRAVNRSSTGVRRFEQLLASGKQAFEAGQDKGTPDTVKQDVEESHELIRGIEERLSSLSTGTETVGEQARREEVLKLSEARERKMAAAILDVVLAQKSWLELEENLSMLEGKINQIAKEGRPERALLKELKTDFQTSKDYAQRISDLVEILERRLHLDPVDDPVMSSDEELLLTTDDPRLIAIALDLPQLDVELQRAFQQVKKSIQKTRLEEGASKAKA